MRFAMPKQAPKGLWRRVPPVVFGPILGAMGLALAWRAAIGTFALPRGLAQMADGVMVMVAGFALLAYGVKLGRRPGVLAEELRVLPGRAGVAAGVLSLYLLGGLVAPYALGLGRGLLVVGLVAHVAALAVLIGVYRAGPAELRRVTPVWHLNWVGFIVAARVALALGWPGLAGAILWPALAAAVAIWAISAAQLARAVPPAPLRPLLAIHVAPAALIGTVALGLGHPLLASVMAWAGLALIVALVASARWLLAAGFSPMWGAMTFPLSASAGLWVMRAGASGAAPDRAIAAVLLVGASAMVPVILFLVLRDWARGRLAVKTNAAIA